MMEQAKKYLSDILRAIELIEQFTKTTGTFIDYSADLKTQSAVERQLGIIGEAVNKCDKLHPDSLAFRLGVMLEEARNEAMITQDELAQRTGTKKSYISRIERGQSDIQIST